VLGKELRVLCAAKRKVPRTIEQGVGSARAGCSRLRSRNEHGWHQPMFEACSERGAGMRQVSLWRKGYCSVVTAIGIDTFLAQRLLIELHRLARVPVTPDRAPWAAARNEASGSRLTGPV